MKRFILPLLLLAMLVSGCASVHVTSERVDMVEVENSGCFLFYCIPLFSGDPAYANQDVCSWFTNTVKLENNVKLMEEAAAERGARTVRNVVSYKEEEIILWLLLKRKIYHTSAELVK